MKIKIISTQIYENCEEKNEEIYEDCNVKFLDKIIIINYNNNEIIYDNGKIEIKRAQNNISIELNKWLVSSYETPYGNTSLKIFGEEIKIHEKPFNLFLKYKIMLGNTSEYQNIIEILEV